jgi:omega-6 fatty acid desaturase (delta-12 desaturase)
MSPGSLKDTKLKDSLRPALTQRPHLAAAGVAGSLLLVATGYWIGLSSSIWLIPVAWIIAGTGLWGCWSMAHDCLHGAFSKHALVNELVGGAVLLPTLFPYYTTKSLHLGHHRHLNNALKDKAWRPWTTQEYASSPKPVQQLYRASRGALWWLAPLMFLAFQHFNAANAYPRERAKARSSFLLVAGYALALFAIAAASTSLVQAAVVFLGAHAVFSTIFAILTLMQHTSGSAAVDAPWHTTDAPGSAAPLEHTLDLSFPLVFELMLWNGNVHTPHHIDPRIPFYNLRAARSLLAADDNNVIKSRPFSFAELATITTGRQVFDLSQGSLGPIPTATPQAQDHSTRESPTVFAGAKR